MAEYRFPKGFLWGTATSAHQIEGNNTNSDWWRYEQEKAADDKWPEEPSGLACDSYNRYDEDFDLCKQLNSDAVRISIEWARIEPEKGKFDDKEIEHYKNVIQAAKSRGLKVFVTLHHFTNPIWFADMGGWVNLSSPKYFERYAELCGKEFGKLADFFMPINEPQVIMLQGYTNGEWPPNKKNPLLLPFVHFNMMRAHKKAYKALKRFSNSPVGVNKNIMWFFAAEDSKIKLIDKLIAKIGFWFASDFFFMWIKKHMDFIGLNFYFTNRIKHLKLQNTDDETSDLGWWIYPNGLKNVLLHLKKYNLPIYITENGLADSEDKQRKEFITEHLTACATAIEQGVNLKGYLHWSLLDNFEWHHGFWPKFGLVEIDRENNLKRVPRGSFHFYSKICKNNSINI